MKVERLVREEVNLDIRGITLLSVEEYKACRQYIKPAGYVWWLRSRCYYDDDSMRVAHVYRSGRVDIYGKDARISNIAVRPALQITNPESANLKIGDNFYLFGYKWTVISKELALCDEAIEKRAFCTDWRPEDANDYEKSDVKRFLEEWFDERRKKEGTK